MITDEHLIMKRPVSALSAQDYDFVIGKTANNVKNRIMSVQGALLGLGAGAFLKSVISLTRYCTILHFH